MNRTRGDDYGRELLREWGRQLRARENPLDAWPSVGPSGQLTEDRNAAGSYGTLVAKHRCWESFTTEDALEVHRWLLTSCGGAGQPEIVRAALRAWYVDRKDHTAAEIAEAMRITRQELYALIGDAQNRVSAWVDARRQAVRESA